MRFKVLPQISLTEFENPMDANDVATTQCAISRGMPPFEIYWKKNGVRIDPNNGILITRSGQRVSILTIESAQAQHRGNYTCIVKSQAGIIEQTIDLQINGIKV